MPVSMMTTTATLKAGQLQQNHGVPSHRGIIQHMSAAQGDDPRQRQSSQQLGISRLTSNQ